jgi:hypothetical protein
LKVEVCTGDIDLVHLGRLQECGDRELFAAAMAAFLRWLAPQLDEVRTKHRLLTAEIRAEIGTFEGVHSRQPGIIAELLAAYRLFLRFAAEMGVDVEGIDEKAKASLLGILGDQAIAQERSKAGRLALDTLASLLLTGRYFLEDIKASESPPAGLETACGWHLENQYQGRDEGRSPEWVRGRIAKQIGFVDVEVGMVYLVPQATIAALNEEKRGSGSTQSFSEVGRELDSEGLCETELEERGGKVTRRSTRQKKIRGANVRVFWVPIKNLFPGLNTPGPVADPLADQAVQLIMDLLGTRPGYGYDDILEIFIKEGGNSDTFDCVCNQLAHRAVITNARGVIARGRGWNRSPSP